MARCAIVTELQRHVVRILRLRVLRGMALIAVLIGQVIVVVDVTCNAVGCDMSAGQREGCSTMVERCRTPCSGRVALGTVLAEVPRSVVRIRRRVVVGQMATDACCWQPLILVVHMTLVAGCCLMRSRERERCIRVIERRGSPCRRCVTRRAIMIEVSRHVIRILWLSVLRRVARIAVRVLQLVVPVHMAILTLNRRMPPRQREIG